MYSARGDVRKGEEEGEKKGRNITCGKERRGGTLTQVGLPSNLCARARQFLEASVQCLRG